MSKEKQSLAIARGIQKSNKSRSSSMPAQDDSGEHYESIADAILAKRQRAKMAEGGEVDLEENAEEAPNFMNPQNLETSKKELYDLDQISPQPEDSNEHGDELEDADEHDRVSRARMKIRAKRGM